MENRKSLERLQPYKVRPASDEIPDCFETGTKNHEGIAGVAAAVDFLAALGRDFGQAYARGPGSVCPGTAALAETGHGRDHGP